jgi:hypothetical protein
MHFLLASRMYYVFNWFDLPHDQRMTRIDVDSADLNSLPENSGAPGSTTVSTPNRTLPPNLGIDVDNNGGNNEENNVDGAQPPSPVIRQCDPPPTSKVL